MNKTILKNIISLFSTRFAGYIIPLISLPYLTRVLGPQAFGELGFATALCQYFIIIVNYGFDLSATQEISKERNNKRRVSEVFFNLIAIRLLSGVIGLFVLGLISNISDVVHGIYPIVFALYLSVLSSALFPQWLFQGKEKLLLISTLRVLIQFMNLFLIFVFVKGPEDIIFAAIITTMPGLIMVLVSFCYIYKLGWIEFVCPSLNIMRNELKNGWDVFLANIVGSMYQSSIPVFLGFFSGPESVAIYTAAYKLFRASQGLYQSVSGAFYPHVNKVYKDSVVKAKDLIITILKIQSILGISVGLLLFILSNIVVELLFGTEYISSGTVLRILSPLCLIIGISNCLGIQTLLTFGFKKEMSRVYLKSSMISLVLSIPSCYFLGAIGAAITVLIIEILVVLLLYREVKIKKIL